MDAFTPGDYEVISTVTIRREPRILPSNAVGGLSVGTRRTVYSVITDKDNATWGRISESDAAGIAQWICLQSLNRKYAQKIDAKPGTDWESRLASLEAWAETIGFKK
jgi:hypothetical protein